MQVKGEKIKKAIKWVSETKGDFPEKELTAIINEANLRFDLNPNESGFLINFFKDQPSE